MNVRMRKLLKNLPLFFILMVSGYHVFSQDAYMDLTDTTNQGLFKNFLGVKLFAADYGVTSLNQDLKFQYTSNNQGYQYIFKHDMNLTGLNNFYNIGLGLDENLGKHLSINFFNTSIGYIQNAWDWNVGVGAGYFVSLNKAQTMRLNASLNVCFESITYSFGSYYDTTQFGFLVDGVNVGAAIKNVKYVNDIWTLSPSLEFMYRRRSFDFFAAVNYNYIIGYYEKINFYENSIPVSKGIYYNQNPAMSPPGSAVSGNVINLNKYVIQIGIIREFGI